MAMRCCTMSQPTLTMCATTRCATKPAESWITRHRHAVGGEQAVRRVAHRGRVTGVVISVRRLAKPNSGSTATVRVGSRCSCSAVVVASCPSGATRQSHVGRRLGAGFDARAELAGELGQCRRVRRDPDQLGLRRRHRLFGQLLGAVLAVDVPAAPASCVRADRRRRAARAGRRAGSATLRSTAGRAIS